MTKTHNNKLSYLKDKLTAYFNPTTDNEKFFIGYQCGLVMAGHIGKDLHDITCAIITSDEYKNA
jgi:hypothetical protein